MGEFDVRAGTRKYLNVVQVSIIHLNVATTKMDLWNHILSRHRTDLVRWNSVSQCGDFISHLPSG